MWNDMTYVRCTAVPCDGFTNVRHGTKLITMQLQMSPTALPLPNDRYGLNFVEVFRQYDLVQL